MGREDGRYMRRRRKLRKGHWAVAHEEEEEEGEGARRRHSGIECLLMCMAGLDSFLNGRRGDHSRRYWLHHGPQPPFSSPPRPAECSIFYVNYNLQEERLRDLH